MSDDTRDIAVRVEASLKGHITDDTRQFDALFDKVAGIYKLLWAAVGGIILTLGTRLIDLIPYVPHSH